MVVNEEDAYESVVGGGRKEGGKDGMGEVEVEKKKDKEVEENVVVEKEEEEWAEEEEEEEEEWYDDDEVHNGLLGW